MTYNDFFSIKYIGYNIIVILGIVLFCGVTLFSVMSDEKKTDFRVPTIIINLTLIFFSN